MAKEEEAVRQQSSSSKLIRAIAASADATSAEASQPLEDVELSSAKQESVGALVRRHAGRHKHQLVLRVLRSTVPTKESQKCKHQVSRAWVGSYHRANIGGPCAGEPASVAAAKPLKLPAAAAVAGAAAAGARAASGGEFAADSDDGVVEAWGAASSIPPLEPVGPAMLPLDIEREMWQSFAAVRQRRAIRLAKIVLGLVHALTPACLSTLSLSPPVVSCS